jgi:hypothetical protein
VSKEDFSRRRHRPPPWPASSQPEWGNRTAAPPSLSWTASRNAGRQALLGFLSAGAPSSRSPSLSPRLRSTSRHSVSPGSLTVSSCLDPALPCRYLSAQRQRRRHLVPATMEKLADDQFFPLFQCMYVTFSCA